VDEYNLPEEEKLEVFGARTHNLKNIDLAFNRGELVVFTGLSGSGKSSLAFDTIFAEGQRRYIESFSAYARQFLGNLERPDVDKINGLSPVISIEQKSVNKSPRSTVGTITEIYDFLRLLYARAGDAYSYNTGEKMVKYSEQQIKDLILEQFEGKKILVLAPLIKGRKGHYRELFQSIRKQGFLKVRIDGEVKDIVERMQVDRYKIHDIEVVVDRIKVDAEQQIRIKEALQLGMKHGNGSVIIMNHDTEETKFYSQNLMCPTTGISYDEPAPNLFSFNSPYGACSNCNGLGEISEIDQSKIIPDNTKSIKKGGIAPLGAFKNSWVYTQIEAIGEKYGFKLTTPIKDISDEAIRVLLFGTDDEIEVTSEIVGISKSYNVKFEGIANLLQRQFEENPTNTIKRWAEGFMNKSNCPVCEGTRLKKQSLNFKINEKNIAELAQMDIVELGSWFEGIEKKLSEKQNIIARDVLKEIRARIGFLLDVGLDYLTLNRSSRSLSGGEAQRIRLATQIGSKLVGVLYILDEPSIGLHQRDNDRLITALKDLRDIGNSVIVVEHES
jgi:excinuclease ABC subunit A